MMYIRTRDGRIVDTTKYPEHPASWSVQASDYALTINQSENLEELLDRYVLYEKGSNDYHIIQAKVLNGGWLQYYKKFYEEITVYGAVWCEFGLKYVAKLNSKGELELL